MKIIDGKLLAEELNKDLARKNLLFKQKFHKKPYLAVVLVGDNAASSIYVKNKEKQANIVGIESEVINLNKSVSEKELLDVIESLNKNNKVDGILVQLPLPNHIDSKNVIDNINPDKDVDGFNARNIGLLAMGIPKVIPCTPLGCYKMLENVTNLEGKKIAVLGRSNIVGKPLAYLLTNKNATVTLIHSKSKGIKEICMNSDIIVAAIGKPKFVKHTWVHKKSIVIDVGINVISERGRRKIVGDVDFEKTFSKVRAISPVPGGVGPMTIHCLLLNTYNLAYLKVNL